MKDGNNYALLVGVGKFNNDDITDLPTYEKDTTLISDALIQGLGFSHENIRIVGEDGNVTSKAFTYAILNFKKALTEDDTFVLYYSGHGKDNALYFSDTLVEINSIVRVVDSLPARRKWIILDCCHSGAAKSPDTVMVPRMTDLKLSDFVDHGTTIMASTGAMQRSSFDEDHSLYTGMLCRAIMSNRTTRDGRKSLWDVNDMVLYMMDEWNRENSEKIQYPIFRSSEIGSVSFKVSEMNSSKEDSEPDIKPIFTSEDYIVTEARSLSTVSVKRTTAFIILNCERTDDNIVRITNEVALLVKGMDFDNRHIGRDAKVVWCYFGADTSDMIKSNYFAYTIWSDDPEQRNIHFRDNKNAHIVNDIYIFKNGSYDLVRKLNQPEVSCEEYKAELNKAVSDIINMGEIFVRDITEVYNKTMDISAFRNAYVTWVKKIKKDYIKLSDMSSPPDEIYDYSEKVLELAGWLVDLGIYVEGDKELEPIDHWVIKNAVRRYHESIGIITNLQEDIG